MTPVQTREVESSLHVACPSLRQNSPRSTLPLVNLLVILIRFTWSTSIKSSSLTAKGNFEDVRTEVLSLMIDESDDLNTTVLKMDQGIFDMSLEIKKLLYNPGHAPEATTPTAETRGVKLPKVDVPMFDGDILHWQTFWEQFSVAIHDRTNISDTEKLVYLRHSLKDGSAKSIIEGLSRSGEQYAEAIKSLKSRYSRPRLIHQTHI